jgi:hypothetical protein
LADVYVRTLERAAQMTGGEQALALSLKVTPSHPSLWLLGAERPPTHVFLRAVDIVTAGLVPDADRPAPKA